MPESRADTQSEGTGQALGLPQAAVHPPLGFRRRLKLCANFIQGALL